ncbi:uncharacterized protein N7482_009031 [Penicillium canariense]|uniref:Major facilitator superfamily (MFS) profile domain-containing protein n=1 Tax=Penicillium canariense TaxID=189055 RepID=A0A9W9HM08_9EURO|nr:uncharacterized protein N7482_009031 [Penicillium canariense]KAJ5152553.1 hypothetical protein N7482_009031 [Penicillium canariense]
MGFGILEANRGLAHVPGTVLLEDMEPLTTAHLKKGSGKNATVVLTPQPSNNPNDPLNWPLWQRDLLLVLFCFLTTICVGAIGPMLSVLTLSLTMAFGITIPQTSLLTGYQFCVVGAMALPVAAFLRKFGKRPIFIVSILFLLAGSIICSQAIGYHSMLAGRIIQGFGTTAFESAPFGLIGDMYFVHQRGSRMAIYITAQVGLVLLPGLIAGVITINLSWEWAFYILIIFLGIGLILLVLFGWETSYNRAAVYNVDTSSQDNLHALEEIKSGATHTESSDLAGLDLTTMTSTIPLPRDSFVRRMKPWSTTYTEDSIIKMTLRPAIVLLNPVILWAVLIIAVTQLWSVCTAFLIAQIFGPPPYLLNTAQVGYIGAGPIISIIVCCILYGIMADPLAKALAKRNNGIFEPEFRLVPMIISPILSSLGYFLFGNLIAKGVTPIGASAVWALSSGSIIFIGNPLSNYLVDAFRDSSVEVFIASMGIKNFLFFGFSYFLNEWFARWGPAKVYDCIGGLMLILSLTAIPVYIFGKRLRGWWHIHDITLKFK